MVASKLLLGAILSSTSVLGVYIPHVPRAEPSKSHNSSSMSTSMGVSKSTSGYHTVSITSAGRVVSTMVYPKNMTMHGTGTGTGGMPHMPTVTGYPTMKPGHNKTMTSSMMDDEDGYDMEPTSTHMMDDDEDMYTSTYSFNEKTTTSMDDKHTTTARPYPTMDPKHNMTKTHTMDDGENYDDEDEDMYHTGTKTGMKVTFTGVSSVKMTSTATDDDLGIETASATLDDDEYMPTQTMDDDEGGLEETGTMAEEMPEETSDMEDMPEETDTGMEEMPEETDTGMEEMPEETDTRDYEEGIPVSTAMKQTTTSSTTVVITLMPTTITTEIIPDATPSTTAETTEAAKPSTTATTTIPAIPTVVPVPAIPTSPAANSEDIFTDKTRYQAYSKVPGDQLVFISNHMFQDPDKWGKPKMIANEELRNSMVAGKAWFESQKEKNGKDSGCTAPAYKGGAPTDPLIYCNKKSRYGVRLNNLMDSDWSENCWDLINNAVWLSQAVTSGNIGIPEGEMPEYYKTANNPVPTRFFQHKDIEPTPERPWNVSGQVFKGGNPLRMAYITLENPGCPDEWKDTEA
ncbi:hypothetical protein TWF506_005297 [Arthrobotrys conoides]|uniref:Uncharacterized protein n=1 Tax=Arthrobotrys conoides TaxID=74498 RepID=A0AAN8NJE0_9PEZI